MFCALIALMPELVIKMRRWRNYRAINNSYFTQIKVLPNSKQATSVHEVFFANIVSRCKGLIQTLLMTTKIHLNKFQSWQGIADYTFEINFI